VHGFDESIKHVHWKGPHISRAVLTAMGARGKENPAHIA
jgi:hypothetical protein